MKEFLDALPLIFLVVALCADYPQTVPLCPCGCGNPVHKHNPPRSAA